MDKLELLSSFDPDILIEAGLKAKEEMNRKKILESHPYKITELHLKDRTCYQTYILVDGKRKQIRKSSKEAVESYILDFYKTETKEPTVESLYSEWIAYRSRSKCGGTVKKDIWVWERYYSGSKLVQTPVKQLKVPYITNELLSISDEMGLTKRKFREMKSLLNSILDYAVYMDYISINPARQIHGISSDVFKEETENREEKIFEKDSVVEVIGKAKEYYARYDNAAYLAILINFGLGLRVGELAALKEEDFDFERGELKLVRSEQSVYTDKDGKKVRSGSRVVNHLKKNHAVRYVPLSSYTNDIFKESLEWKRRNGVETDWLFACKDGQRLTTNSINQALNRLCGKGNHTIRRTVITNLVRSSIFTQKEIQMIAGHKDWTTTSKYYDFSYGSGFSDRMDRVVSDNLSDS